MRVAKLSSLSVLLLVAPACGDESGDGGLEGETSGFTTTGIDDSGSTGADGSGSGSTGSDTGTSGDGDGDTSTGDGDGDTTTGDGDGDSTTGDGDGDSTTGDGDGDGDSTTGDGDGDGDSTTGDGDGDGDSTTGDGDGDSTTGGTTGDGDGDGDPECGAPANHITCDASNSNPTQMQIIGLNCPGTEYDSTQTTSSSWSSPDSGAWTTARQFGSSGDWTAREGDQMLVLTTGKVPGPNGNGTVTVSNGQYPNLFGSGNSNPDGQALPGPIRSAHGSNGTPFMGCDGVNDCSDSLLAQWQLGDEEANDLLWFQFSVDVPVDTYGWTMDFNYLTAEYPNYVGDSFNDIFVVWESSEAYTGNVCFVDGQPCTVTALAGAIQNTGAGGSPPGSAAMAGTGMSNSEGGGTGWYQIEAASVPEENVEITIALFDMGDSIFDTVTLVDNWRWNCEGCDPTIPGDCGVTPAPQ